jgi:hypothetical protein
MGNAMNDRREYEHARAEKIVGNSASKPVTEANARQIGGEHYQAEYQHWDFVAKHRLDYFDGNASKYVARAYKKGDAYEQFQKAQHYVQKKIELGRVSDTDWSVAVALGQSFLDDLYCFAVANGLSFDQTVILHALLRSDYHLVDILLDDMLRKFSPQSTKAG